MGYRRLQRIIDFAGSDSRVVLSSQLPQDGWLKLEPMASAGDVAVYARGGRPLIYLIPGILRALTLMVSHKGEEAAAIAEIGLLRELDCKIAEGFTGIHSAEGEHTDKYYTE